MKFLRRSQQPVFLEGLKKNHATGLIRTNRQSKVTAVLPAYNAALTLTRTVQDIPTDWVDEIILVDDVSRDATADLAEKLGLVVVRHTRNQGYGGNQKTCYRVALERQADVVVMVHPDFQYDPSFIPELIQPILEGRTDIVFGSRMLIKKNALNGGMPYWKFIANICLTQLANIILGIRLSEYHSGFRAYSREFLQRVPFALNSNNFVFDTEIIIQAVVGHYRIHEVPIATRYFHEASSIGFFKSVQYGFHILGSLFVYPLYRLRLARPTKYTAVTPTTQSF